MKYKTVTFYQWCIDNKKKILLYEWDREENETSPSDFSYGSNKKVWWICSKCGNKFKATIKNRKSGTGCKICGFKKISSTLSKRNFNDSLKNKYPQLMKEWDIEKNGIKPDEIAPYSEKIAWWICSKGHSYSKKIYERTKKKSGCPYCSGKRVLEGFNDLKTTNPRLAMEWHSVKNSSKPTQFTQYSNKKVWWICSKGHEWYASINNRAHLNRGCPYCSHKKAIIGENDLEYSCPSIVKQWDYKRNGSLKPNDVLTKSNKKVWWVCSKGHEWKTTVYNRTIREDGCPYCSNKKVIKGFNDLETKNQELIKEWDFEKNVNMKPTEYTPGSGIKVWWKCSKGHSYQADIHNRTAGYGCPYCANQKVLKGYNDLETTNPDLAKEWDYEKNNKLKPSDVIRGSHKKVWWICKNKHHYQASIVLRSKGTGCPICNKKKKSSFPEQAIYYYIKKEFPDAINGYKNKEIFGSRMELDIYIPSVRVGIEYDGRAFHDKERLVNDNKKYELCKKNKIVLIRIEEMQESNLFRNCDHKIEIKPEDINWLNYAINKLCYHLGKNVIPNIDEDRNEILCLLDKRKTNLLEKFPEIAKEWDYKKNYPLIPENVAPHSGVKVWWKCSKGHEWFTSVGHRTTKNTKCPYCNKLKLPKYVKSNLKQYKPAIAKCWDYSKNKELMPEMVGGRSSVIAWFKCPECSYSWKDRISNLTKRKYICPKCRYK